jgi:hypothetical protein
MVGQKYMSVHCRGGMQLFEVHVEGVTLWGLFLWSQYATGVIPQSLDVHESVHRDTTMKITNKMQYID